MGFEETSSVGYDLSETQTCNYFLLLLGREDSADPRKHVARGEKLWSSETLLYPGKYIQLAFSCVMEKLLISYIYEI